MYNRNRQKRYEFFLKKLWKGVEVFGRFWGGLAFKGEVVTRPDRMWVVCSKVGTLELMPRTCS